MAAVYEVIVEYRIVNRHTGKPIRGKQGRWQDGVYLVVAADEVAAELAATAKVKAKRMIGINKRRATTLERQVKIFRTRRLP